MSTVGTLEKTTTPSVIASPVPRADQVGLLNRRAVRVLLGALVPVGLLVFWQVGASTGLINMAIMSSPEKIVTTGVDMIANGQLQTHLLASLRRAVTGFCIGVLIGTVLGYLSARVTVLDRLLDPSVQLFRAIPQSALLPLFVVWFGFGELPKVMLIILVIVPTIYIHTHTGLKNVDPKLLEVGSAFGLNRRQVAWKILIPNALPFLFNGLRLTAITSLIILVLAETLNADVGLGFVASQAVAFFQVDKVLLVAAIYALLGITADLSLRSIQYLVTPWNRATR